MILKSFRNKLFASFLFFVFIIIFTAVEIFWFNYKLSGLTSVETELKKMMILNLQVYKTEKVFIQKELTNLEFFKTGKSKILDAHEKYINENIQTVEGLKQNDKIREFGLLLELNSLSIMLKKYETSFHKTITKIKQRGFKDYGLEGAMRRNVHLLELKYPEFNKVTLLTMRRHEKDYIIRNDQQYVLKLNKVCNAAMKAHYTSNLVRQARIRNLLTNYLTAFNTLAAYDKEINEGFDQLHQYFFVNIEQITTNLNEKSSKKIREQADYLSTIFTIVLWSSIIISIGMSYFLSRIITQPIINLTRSVERIVNNDFEVNSDIPYEFAKDEVGILSERFYFMVSRIKNYIEQIKDTNNTLEKQNIHLYSLNADLKQTNDVLQRKDEHIQKMNAVKDKFFAILSHDLRGPLTTIKGFLSIMTDHPDSIPEALKKQTLIKLKKSIEIQLELLSNLLDWSSAQVDEIRFNPEFLNVAIMVDKNIELVAEKANFKNIAIINSMEDNISLLADKNMIDFVLRNLISNALKFTNKGGKIVIRSEVTKEFTEITISDNGVGISEKSLKFILKPGIHFTTSGTGNEKGTGFGLLLCKEFIEKHGGRIKIKSKDNEGTSVTFSIKNNLENLPSYKSLKNRIGVSLQNNKLYKPDLI